jgi:acyl-CoA synthetase (AMP-forming)/AMP-acid ligase II
MTARLADPLPPPATLAERIRAALDRGSAGRAPRLDDGARSVALTALAARAWVEAPDEALVGRNLLVVTDRPLSAALALCGLDGAAARLVLCPPDLDRADLPRVMAAAQAHAIVHDLADPRALPAGVPAYAISRAADGSGPAIARQRPGSQGRASQWALFTSGTTGAPKMAVHDLAGLTDAIPSGAIQPGADDAIVWATFYDIRRFGGLQMLLRALTGAHDLVLTGPGEPMADFISRMAAAGVTHVSGTPSHWRSALMRPALAQLSPRYLRLSGEIADQAVLDALARAFPGAAVGHAYASTEAGVGFEVTDGREGFPAAYLTRQGPVAMAVRDGTLRLRSARAAKLYLGGDGGEVADADGFVDTGDLVERRDERFHFMGRASGVINVGGLKAHPEEVEAAINRCPAVRMALVKARRSPIMGAIVAADVVLADPAQAAGEPGRAIREAILAVCRASLAAHKVPAVLRFVEDLPMTAGGKLERRHA